MTLVIKPVQLNKSVYIRVPNDLADLIDLSKKDEFNLSFQETDSDFHLVYSIPKHETGQQRKISSIIATTR